MTLLGVLGHDRPEGLERCLQGVARAGADARVVIHLDDADLESRAVAYASGYDVIGTLEPIGIGASLNRILAFRQPGEAFVRIDGDTEVMTEGWLALMLDALDSPTPRRQGWATLSTVLRTWEGEWTRGVPPGDGVIGIKMGRGIGSVMVCRGDVVDHLGGFREGYPYAFEDTDWYGRITKAYHTRLRAGTDLRVVAVEAAPPSRKLWRFEQAPSVMDEAFRKAREVFYAEDKPIHRPVGLPGEAVIGGRV